VQAETRDATGQMLVPVQAGQNVVKIDLQRTWDRKVGSGTSAAATVIVLLLIGVTVSRRETVV
jgi:hypothetical protein